MNETERIRVVIVGTDALKTSLYVFRKLGINRVNKANEVNKLNKVDEGRFGNFYTKTYEVEFSETELNSIMKERTRIANTLAAESTLLVTSRQGNALDLYVFDIRAFT